MKKHILIILLGMSVIFSSANANPVSSKSFAFDIESGKFIYNEIHSDEFSTEGLKKRISNFVDDKGDLISRRVMEFNKDLARPNFTIEDFRIGYLEGAEVLSSNKVKVFKRESFDEKLEETILTIDGDYVIDGGLTFYFQQNWQKLLKGERLEFYFVTPNRLDYYSFRVYKKDIHEINGRKGMRLILEPASFILRQFVDPILITYELESKEILLYEGISNVYDENGNIYNVKIDYTMEDHK